MIVVKTDDVKPEDRPSISLKTLFPEDSIEGGKTAFGYVTVPPKARIPLTGTGAHDGNEYSIIVKGSILSVSGEKEYRLTKGDATLIPAGEEHWAYNDGEEDCEIVFALVRT